MGQQFTILAVLVSVLYSVAASPIQGTADLSRRDGIISLINSTGESLPVVVDQSVANYVDPNSGKINYAGLYADTAATPITISINPTSTVAATVSSSALVASASAGAQDNLTTISSSAPVQTNSPSRRSVKEEKRDVAPTWDPNSCPNPGQTKGVDVSNWDPAGFSGNSWISSLYAQNAGAPDGFSRVYVGADGIPIGTTSSITQAIIPLDSYDVASCKGACDYYNCQSFSVFATRDTTVDMNTVDLGKCNNPPGLLLFNCAIYGSTITKEMINETGQIKGNYFKTAIAAANGYVRSSIDKSIEGYTNTVYNGGTTSNGATAGSLLEIYNPNENANVIGYQPELCAARCSANALCFGFDAAEVLADGNFVGTQCLLYNKLIGSDQGNNAGQWGNDGKWYSFQPSVFYAKDLEQYESFYLKFNGLYPLYSLIENKYATAYYFGYSLSFTEDKSKSITFSLEKGTNRIITTQGGRLYYLSYQFGHSPSYIVSPAYMAFEANDLHYIDGAINAGVLTLSNEDSPPRNGYTTFYQCPSLYYGNLGGVDGCSSLTMSIESAN